MNYVRKVDFDAIRDAAERFTQPLLDHTSGGTTCSVNCIKTPPNGGSPAGLHTHWVDQLFYIISGTMHIEIAGEQHAAGPGSLVVFPAGVPHRNWNEGSEPTVHLAINTPLPDPEAPFARPAT